MTRAAKQWATTGFIIGAGSGIAIIVIAFLLLRGAPPAVAATAPAAKAAPSGTLLSGTLQANVKGPVIVFLIARVNGAKGHPVLAKRLDVAAFPAKFALSSSDAMMDGTPPPVVTLEARVDRDGDALTKEPGAPIAVIPNVKLGTAGLTVTLR